MATTRIMPLHTGKGRSVGNAIRDILDYVENPDKTDRAGSLRPMAATAPLRTRNFCSASSSTSPEPAGGGGRTT